MNKIKENWHYIVLVAVIVAVVGGIINSRDTKEEIKTHIETINKLRTIVDAQEKTIKSLEEKRDIVEVTEIKPDGSKKITKTDKTVIKSKEDKETKTNTLTDLSQLKVEDTYKKTESSSNMFFLGVGTTNKLDKNIHIHYKKSNTLYQIYSDTELNRFGGSISIGF